MCGIVGGNILPREKEIIKSLEVLKHRGPDAQHFICFKDKRVFLGHTRLAILDLNPRANQPMTVDGRFYIVFNGEIYNHLEIREELKKYETTVEFKTTSDTETILHAFKKWGPCCVNKFNGMFAFCIYDRKKNIFYLARDRIGKKPLYIFFKDNKLIFASEIKAILIFLNSLPEMDKNGLISYLMLGYVREPFSIFKNITKLPKGSYGIFDGKELKIENYDKMDLEFEINFDNYQEVKQYLRILIEDAVKKRLLSDVPVGVFLSGGTDSSLITAFMRKHSGEKIKTFSICFKESKIDESRFAKKVAELLETEHYEFFFTEKDLVNKLEEFISYIDEPFADQSILPTMLLSEFTRKKVVVALSGDGGDELFGGYEHYKIIKKLYLFFKLPAFLRNGLKVFTYFTGDKGKKIISGLTQPNICKLHLYLTSYWLNSYLTSLLFKDPQINTHFQICYHCYSQEECLKKAMNFDKNFFLADDIFVKVDRASMKYALECRAPLVDYRIIKFTEKVPVKFKIRKNHQKILLKELLKEFLPEELVERRKQGFVIPLRKWLNSVLKKEIEYFLSETFIKKQELFNYYTVKKIKEEHFSQKYFHTGKIWNLYIFQKWWNKVYG